MISKKIPPSMRSAYAKACLDHGFDPLRFAPYSRMTVYEALAALGYDPLRNYDAEPPRPPRCAHPGCEFRAKRLGERYCDIHTPVT
ncbi:MAG: hypothetical protein N2320_06695, partial [Candidatus Bipolaricaulota bacterium]|nr:hypothetical protein [Candidatus Bipolaricaulota bacterium]